MLKTQPADALKWLVRYVQGKAYDIMPHVEKRSRNANSYAWLLITKLSEELAYPKEEIYRRAIRDIGGKTTIMTLRTNALQDFTRAFINGHLGRNVEILQSDADKTDILITYGSSDFDTKQMSQLIESLVQDCKACGIETKPQEYIDSLLKEWGT